MFNTNKNYTWNGKKWIEENIKISQKLKILLTVNAELEKFPIFMLKSFQNGL